MKPRTKFERSVAEANATLVEGMTEKVFEYAKRNACDHFAWRTKHTCVCTECGQKIDVNTMRIRKDKTTCPHCGTRLVVEQTRRLHTENRSYFMVIDRVGNFQVFRYYVVFQYLYRKRSALYHFEEVFRLFMDNTGRTAICAKLRSYMFGYIDKWKYDSEIELRPQNSHWNISPYRVIPVASYSIKPLLAECRKRGLKAPDFCNVNPTDIVPKLFCSPQCETLWKTGYKNIVTTLSDTQITTIWPALKICIRNKYRINNINDYYDYIYQLTELGRDTHNAHYVCPADLTEAHTETTRIIQHRRAVERLRKEQELIRERERAYAEQMVKWLPLAFAKNGINIRVLQSVQEFYDEGNAMHHCVYSCGYYKRPDCLILTARDDDNRRLATIEINLKNYSIIQIRDRCNKVPPRYDEIESLIKKNMRNIRKIGRKTAAA